MAGGRYAWPAGPSDEEVEWVRGVLESSGKPSNALDPLCGKGTVLYECALRGWKCTGMEADPFMRWISSVRSFRFRTDAAEFAGYAWERVADNVFWESDMFTVPAVPGTMEFGTLQLDYLRRVRRQIDRESDDGINNLLRLMLCSSLAMVRDAESFDDTVGMGILGEALHAVRSGIEPNAERSQTVHLCDARDMPCPLRNSYDLVVSVLPSICESPDAELLRTMGQWLGFGDLERRDDLSIGYPLGGFQDYMSRYMPLDDGRVRDMVPVVSQGAEQDYLVRWFEDVCRLLDSMKGVMSRKCRMSLLAPEETYCGTRIDKAELIAQIAPLCGLDCEKEGTGANRCVVFEKPQ